ncbi:DUF2341 domain-containing protein [Mucilaginibacter sp. BJC16-A38]|uniref:DUF2341 domain-containing protein n=1 Tax=Mucilaginibacter phenanthrenivorans TaxID=1234842 RepID=UPI002157BC67|nr:DUF2341 domain-containing protein [Mucilaginibacter phenanthrenivorans]MCR8557685.1 DUF2341 domain-containing protein [Mucilaginibacter phenanthrenivorans]
MEKRLLRIFVLFLFCFVCFTTAFAQTPTPGTVTFQYQGNYQLVYGYAGFSCYVPASGTATQDMGLGYEFVTQGTVSTPGGASLYVSSYSYPFAFNDGMISFDRSSTSLSVNAAYIMSAATGATTTNSATSLPTPGGEFQLVSINLLTVSGTSNVSVQAYANGVAIGSPVTKSVGSTTKVLFDFSTNSSFYSIDEIKITGFGTAGIRADDIKSAALTISVSAAGNPGCGAGSVTLTASGGTPSGGTYSWYNSSSTITPDPVLGTGTSFSPIVSGSYYAIYTQGSTSITSSNTTVTINPIVSSPVANASFSYPFTGNTKDISGNQNDGIPQNAPTLTTDRYGAANSAYTFNGTTQFIETTTPFVSPQVFTISLWFNTTTTTGGRLIGFSGAQNGGGQFDRHIYMVNSGQLYFGVYSGATHTLTTTNSYNDGTWHHVVGTLSSAGMKLYVDNVLQDSNPLYTAAESVTGYWEIGGNNLSGWPSGTGVTSAYFKGTIDDVSVYSTDLSTTGITTINDINQIGAYAPVCPGSSLTIYSPLITGATYNWTDPNGAAATGQNPTFTNAVAGNYTLTVTGGPGGCSSTATVTPTFYTTPAATFTATSTVNTGVNATVTLTSTYDPTLTYAWNFNSGTPTTGTGQGPFSVSWSTAGVKTITLTVSNANGCSSTITQTVIVGSASWYSTYVFRKKILLDRTKISGAANLTSFPVLLKIVDPDLVYTANSCTNKIQSTTLADLAFTDATTGQTAELPYQIDNYDSSTNTLLVWVQIPTLSASGTGTAIYYYFGSNAPASHPATTSTWSSDYQGVYHFNESAFSSATGAIKDATTNVRNATAITANAVTSTLVAGQISNAYTFAGAQKISTAGTLNFASTFTLSAWVNPSSLPDEKIMSNQNTSYIGYKLGFYNSLLEAEAGSNSTTRGSNSSTSTPISVNNWYYVQSVYNGATLSTYVNGILNSSIALTTNTPSTTLPFSIGVGEGGNILYFNGMIDEVRTSNVAKTSDWLLTEYNNQLNPSSTGTAPFISSIAANEWSQTNFTAGYAPGSVIYTWTGGTSTSPTAANNWNNTTMGVTNQVPPATYSSLSIPNVTTKPTLTAALSAYSLTLSNGATFNLGGQTLSIGCNIYNNSTTGGTGILDGSSTASGITWNGKLSAQSYTGSNTASTAAIGNMTIANTAGGTVTITGGPVEISNLLTLTQGNLIIDNTNNGALTLKGNASSNLNYAQIGPITSGYTISGSINYQVYFTGVRNYRSMAPPVYNNTTTYSSTNGTYSLASLKGTGGFIITGSGGSTNGFDKSSNNGPTLRIYNAATNVYTFITSLNTAPTVATGSAFYMYFRGSRTPAGIATAADPFGSKTNKVDGGGSYAAADAVMYTYTGVPNQGNVTSVPAFATTDTKFYFLANPYAATLDANAIFSAGPIKTSTWIWNPSLGNYAVYNSTNAALIVNGGKRYIVPGQGFFIQAATTSATTHVLTLTESMKSVANNLNAARMLSASEPLTTVAPPIFRLKFAKDSVLSDEIAVEFSDSSKATLDYNDATHLEGTNLTLSSLTTDNEYLAIDVRPFTGKKTTMPLYITPAQDTTYTLKLSYKNPAMSYYKVSLQDSLLNTTTDITNTTYSFNIASGQQNTYAKRFKLIVEALPAPALFTKFAGQLDNLKKVLLNWNGGTDRASITYQVQKSVDNKTFVNIGTSLTGSSNINYQTVDSSPAIGLNYYRLVQTDAFNTNIYSDTITIANNPGLLNGIAKNGFILYPNAVTDVVSIVGDKTYQGTVKFRIYDNLGKLQASQSFTGMNAQVPIQENISNLKMGVYTARIDNDSKEIVVIKFIKK